MRGEEALRKHECQWGRAPRDFHDGHEPGFDGRAYLVGGTCAGDEGHAGQVNGILDG